MTATQDNLMYNFAGNRIAEDNKASIEKVNRDNFYSNEYSDNDVTFFEKKVRKHRNDEVNFDYTYCVRVVDLYEATGDEEFNGTDNQFYIEVLLVPMFKSLCKKYKDSVMSDYSGEATKEEIKEYGKSVSCLFDTVDYGIGIRMAEESCNKEDLEFKIDSALYFINMIDRFRGFALDRTWNMIGNNGWDSIKDYVKGVDTWKLLKERRGI